LTRRRFELARLQLESLANIASDEDILSALTEFRKPFVSFKNTFKTKNERVSQLYHAAYKKTVQIINTMPGANPQLARAALTWLLYSPSILSPDELLHALAISVKRNDYGPYRPVMNGRPDLQSVVRFCAGLLTVEENSVRLAHYTTKEYLATNLSQISGTPPGSTLQIDPRSSQVTQEDSDGLATLCLAYLSLDAFNDDYCTDENSISNRLRQFPFYGHAASHLKHYVNGLPVEGNTALEDMCTSFFNNERKICGASQFTRWRVFRPPLKPSPRAAEDPLGLHFATYHGLTTVAKFLLTRQAAIFSPTPTPEALLKARDAEGYTPLCRAARLHEYSLVALFLQYDAASPNHVTRDGPPLVLAAQGRGIPQQWCMESLLEVTREGAVEAMYHAVLKGNRSLIGQLLNAGVDPDVGMKYTDAGMLQGIRDYPRTPLRRRPGEHRDRWLRERDWYRSSSSVSEDTPLKLARRKYGKNSQLCQIMSNPKLALQMNVRNNDLMFGGWLTQPY
jgi:hypothetical protein